MGMFLNSKAPYESYRKMTQNPYFVDKSLLLADLTPYFGSINCYCCITRPRRFGKTVMANMIGAFFGKAWNSGHIFEGLAISNPEIYKTHQNQYNVIAIDFSRAPKGCRSYTQYIQRFENGMVKDLQDAYPDCGVDIDDSPWDALQKVYEKTEQQFLFVLDEWDAPFHMPFFSAENQKEYLLFLKWLLKDQPYAEFAYMTGVLPIAKYSSGSELNMFVEYDMITSEKFSEYFGFSDREVDELYRIYNKNLCLSQQKFSRHGTDSLLSETDADSEKNLPKFSRQELRAWYDGYKAGVRLYNPRSVVLALTDNQLRNYWTSSGPYDEIFYYIRHNIAAVRDDLILMVSGERVPADIGQFAAGAMEITSREQIYSAMVVYGLLTYENGEVLIPNKELMDKFNELLLTKDSLGYVFQLAKKSEQMLQATLSGDTKKMEEILQFAHNILLLN